MRKGYLKCDQCGQEKPEADNLDPAVEWWTVKRPKLGTRAMELRIANDFCSEDCLEAWLEKWRNK
jgi:hypothetical protein